MMSVWDGGLGGDKGSQERRSLCDQDEEHAPKNGVTHIYSHVKVVTPTWSHRPPSGFKPWTLML